MTADEFNKNYKIGTKVLVSPFLGCSEHDKFEAKTAVEAFESNGNNYVSLTKTEGHSALWWGLEYIEVIKE